MYKQLHFDQEKKFKLNNNYNIKYYDNFNKLNEINNQSIYDSEKSLSNPKL